MLARRQRDLARPSMRLGWESPVCYSTPVAPLCRSYRCAACNTKAAAHLCLCLRQGCLMPAALGVCGVEVTADKGTWRASPCVLGGSLPSATAPLLHHFAAATAVLRATLRQQHIHPCSTCTTLTESAHPALLTPHPSQPSALFPPSPSLLPAAPTMLANPHLLAELSLYLPSP